MPRHLLVKTETYAQWVYILHFPSFLTAFVYHNSNKSFNFYNSVRSKFKETYLYISVVLWLSEKGGASLIGGIFLPY